MVDNEAHLIELARKKRLLTKKQARLVQETLDQDAYANAGEVMLAKHYVTDEQLVALRDKGGQEESFDAEDTDKFDGERQEYPHPHPHPQMQPAAATPPSPPTTAKQQQSEQQEAPQATAPQEQQQEAPVASPPARRKTAVEVASEPATLDVASAKKQLARLLHIARHWGASDLHITVGRPPLVRLNGTLREMEEAPVNAADAKLLAFAGLGGSQQQEARALKQLDFALDIPKLGRHRCSIFHQRLGWDSAIRIVLGHVPSIEELGLPESVNQFTQYHQGIVMLAGPGSSGKTTTAAALLDRVNESRSDHIITVEDPIEYIIQPKHCQVTQRQVGRHTQSYGNALKAALREDPDILLIGEMRDLETTSISISAAETGHLVFATMNTSYAARTVAKIVDFYPSDQQKQVLTMVAESLRGVIVQRLLPRIDGSGLVVACEIMVNTTGVAQQVKEGKTHMITSLIQGGKRYGMVLLDESLMNLVQQNIVAPEAAIVYASNKAPFESLINRH